MKAVLTVFSIFPRKGSEANLGRGRSFGYQRPEGDRGRLEEKQQAREARSVLLENEY